MRFKSAKHIVDYIIEAKLDNGKVKYYDFENWLFSNINPMYDKFRGINNFKKVKPYGFMIVFGNDEMEFPDYQLDYFEIKSKLTVSKRAKKLQTVK